MKFARSFVCVVTSIFAISTEDAHKIGMQIWDNETSKRPELLIEWCPHESFPSLGIGHFVWYPGGQSGSFVDDFPLLCDYLQKRGIELPVWLKKARATGAPWATRQEFLQDTERMGQLRALLTQTFDVQIDFIMEQFEREWPCIVKAAPKKRRPHLLRCYDLLNKTLRGKYTLIDYHNFKGSGVRGQTYGLLHVLLAIPCDVTAENITQAFELAAAQALIAHIKESAPTYHPNVFFKGWMNRVSTYTDRTLF